jgi:hypothetical protein
MVRSHWSWRLSVAALVVLVAGVSVSWSQAKKPKDKDKDKKEPSPAVVRTLETQAEKAKTEYVNGLIEVAKGFEDQGLTDKTKETLKSILTVVPDFEPARNRLKELEEAIYKENTFEVEVDASKGWTPAGVGVTRDKPLRLVVEGSLRVILNEQVGPDGMESPDPANGQVNGVPLGALVGVVRDPRANPKDQKIEPFLIGSEKEIAPRNDGILFLKVNLPANSQSKGKYRVQVSGNFVKLQGQ